MWGLEIVKWIFKNSDFSWVHLTILSSQYCKMQTAFVDLWVEACLCYRSHESLY
jgi:hypothetical protein